jgi:hypothetical protein
METRHYNRRKVLEAQYLKRSGIKNRHHLTNKCKGGANDEWNLIRLDTARHNAWHLLFKNLSLPEVIDLLKRLQHIKETQRMNNEYGKEGL